MVTLVIAIHDMQEIDSSLQKALKSAASYDGTPKSRERAQEHLRTVLDGIREPGTAGAAKSIHEYLLARRRRKEIGDPVSPPLKDLLALRSLERSYELALGELVADSPDLECGELLQMAPSLRVIEAWLKSAEERHAKAGDETGVTSPKEELIGFVKRDPDSAAACGLGEWFMGNVAAESLMETIPVLLAAFCQKGENRKEAMVRKALSRDRNGNLLLRCVNEVATSAERLVDLAGVVRNDDKTLVKVLEMIPKALLGSEDGRLGELVPMLFENVDREKGVRRRQECGLLVELYGKLLGAEGESVGLRVALAGLDDLFRRFDSLAESEGKGSEPLWVVKAAGAPTQTRIDLLPALTLDQAKLLAAAVERLRENPGAIGVVEALAANLGLESVGASDGEVRFDPLVHEDMVGGMLPGDRAVIRRPGWKLGDYLILRATVD